MLIKDRNFLELDRVFRRVTLLSTLAMILAAGTFWLLLVGLNSLEYSVVDRLLGPLPTGLLLLAALVQVPANSLVYYVRAHKQEPFLVIGVMSNCLVGLMIWRLGSWYGPTGAAFGLLATNALFTLPWHFVIWLRCRRQRE
jgi:hypothetical protein